MIRAGENGGMPLQYPSKKRTWRDGNQMPMGAAIQSIGGTAMARE